MSRRRNYGFDRKRRDELRRARQELKRGRKALRTTTGEAGPEMGEVQETGPPPGRWEWFSASRGRVTTTRAGETPRDETPNDWVLMSDPGSDPAGDAPAF